MLWPYPPTQVDEGDNGENSIYWCACCLKGTLGQEAMTSLLESLRGVGNTGNGIKATITHWGRGHPLWKNSFCKSEQDKVEKAKPQNVLKSFRLSLDLNSNHQNHNSLGFRCVEVSLFIQPEIHPPFTPHKQNGSLPNAALRTAF